MLPTLLLAAAAATPTPTIPAEALAEYWHAELRATQAEVARRAAADKLAQACGPDHTPQLAGGAKIICAPNPKPKPEEKPPK